MTRPTRLSDELPILTHYLGRDPVTVTSLTSNSTVDYAEGIDVFVPGGGGDIALVQSNEGGSGLGVQGTVSLDDTATAGNLLIASFATRGSDDDPTTPDGWTIHPDGTVDTGGSSLVVMYYKTSDGTETDITFSPAGGGGWVGGISEWPSGLTLDDSAETSGTTAPPDLSGAEVTPTAGSAALIVGAMAIAAGDAAETGTPDAGWTELHDAKVPTDLNPHLYCAYRVEASASGSYTPSASVTESNPAAFAAQTIVFTASGNLVNGGANATDGNDATYAGPSTDFYLSLSEARRIVRAELRLAWENSGSRTVTIYGANEADFSDEVELESDTVTATGSWTAQDETLSWADLGAFRYYHLVVSVTARLHTWEMYEASLTSGSSAHEHDYVRRITSNGSNVLLNPFLAITSGAGIAFAASSNNLTISSTVSGGGSVSIAAGSNSSHVAEISSAGASSTLWSPYDHMHAGVAQITASSSNTLQRGTVNLRPGTNVAFGLTDADSDGEFDTLTINSTAAGGGGSPAAALTPWVVPVEVFVSTSNTNWDSFTAGHMHSSGAQNDELIFGGVTLDAGTWMIEGRFFRSSNHGIITFSLDGASVGTIDEFGGVLDNWYATATGIVIATGDTFQLSLKMATKNAGSGGYYGLVKYLQFRRTA